MFNIPTGLNRISSNVQKDIRQYDSWNWTVAMIGEAIMVMRAEAITVVRT